MAIPLSAFVDRPGSLERIAALGYLLDRTGIDARALVSEHVRYGNGGARVAIMDRNLFEDDAGWLRETNAVLEAVRGTRGRGELLRALFVQTGDAWHSRHDLAVVVSGLLNRREETLSTERDEHGRWPMKASLLHKHDLVARPAVDLIGAALGDALREAVPQLPPAPSRWGGNEWAFALTWDIDSAGMYRHGGLLSSVRRVARERGLAQGIASLAEGIPAALGLTRDPHHNFDEIADALDDIDVRSTFFAQAFRRHRLDSHDDIRLMRDHVRALRRLRGRGHEIGLHSSYVTTENKPAFLLAQQSTVEMCVGGRISSHRAHYLRTRGPEDTVLYGKAQLKIDSTVGFAEREGFRTGTAIPYRPWNPLRKRPSLTIEAPLCAMDVTLRYHRALDPQSAWHAATAVIEEARRVGGLAVVLWHPHNLEPRLWAQWRHFPFRLAKWAVERGARTGTLAELVECFRGSACR